MSDSGVLRHVHRQFSGGNYDVFVIGIALVTSLELDFKFMLSL